MTRRSPILLLAGPLLLACFVLLGIQWSKSETPLPMRDFPEYWSAGAAFLHHENPYDPATLLKYQQECDPGRDHAMMMWNPPYALPLVTPFALLPPRPAQALWLLTQLVLVLASLAMLLKVYPLPGNAWIVAVIATLVFAPLYLLILYGQIGGVCLLGLAGCLFFEKRKQFSTAGAFAALTALKPHLLFLFGLALVLNALVSSNGRRVVRGGAIALGLAAFAAWVIDPVVYTHYVKSITAGSSATHNSVQDWVLPLASYHIRMAFDPERFWIQMLPTVSASAAFLAFWILRPKTIELSRAVPALVILSCLFTAYSGWLFDLVVLLVPVLQALRWLVRIWFSSPPWLCREGPGEGGDFPAQKHISPAGSGDPPPTPPCKAREGSRNAVLALAVVYLLLNLGISLGLSLASSLFDFNIGLNHLIFFTPAIGVLYVLASRIASPSEKA